jgi:hypothetical protein
MPPATIEAQTLSMTMSLLVVVGAMVIANPGGRWRP